MQESSAVIISLHPEHANKVLSGQKRLEFRRVWATKPVTAVVIYSTVPVKKIVAIAYVKQVHLGSPTYLWNLAKSIGGGLSRRALYKYFQGKKKGYAVEFESIKLCNPAIDPESLIHGFHAPQSFTYLDQKIFNKIEGLITKDPNESGKVIFIAGVHGVGKSSMCEEFSKEFSAMHKSASQLIREAKEEALEKDTKVVKDIAGNQQLLIDSVSRIRASGRNLLLDGHFALLNADSAPTPLPTDVFSDLAIDGVVVVHDDPSSIAFRMGNRDGKSMGENEIYSLQVLELERSEQVAKELCLPHVKLKSLDQSGFNKVVRELFNKD